MTPAAILESALYVTDLDAAEAFYADVLGLERIAKVEGRHVFFRCGAGVLLLFQPDVTVVPPAVVQPRYSRAGPLTAATCAPPGGASADVWTVPEGTEPVTMSCSGLAPITARWLSVEAVNTGPIDSREKSPEHPATPAAASIAADTRRKFLDRRISCSRCMAPTRRRSKTPRTSRRNQR